MVKIDGIGPRVIFSLLLIIGLLNMPIPVFSQDEATFQDLILNGGFEEGFQGEFGTGFGWGAFSNGNAAVGWSADNWDKVVIGGQNAQLIEIRDATEQNRYAGIYQTIKVVPGQQYKLTLNGLIRSEEGDIELSDYGYRLQYAVDYNGGTAWELIDDDEWVELIWDEQPLSDPPEGAYRFDTFETTITAKGETLTLFIRGWKKWVNKGSGLFNLDEISLVGPAPETAQAPEVQPQAASVDELESPTEAEAVTTDTSAQLSEEDSNVPTEPSQADETMSQTDRSPEAETSSQTETTGALETEPVSEAESSSAQPDSSTSLQQLASPPAGESRLPESGQGSDGSINYILMSGAALLLVLFVGAIAATRQ